MSDPRKGTSADWAAKAERAAERARRAWMRMPDRPADLAHRKLRNAAKAAAFRALAWARRARTAARYHDRREAMHAEDQTNIAAAIVRELAKLARST